MPILSSELMVSIGDLFHATHTLHHEATHIIVGYQGEREVGRITNVRIYRGAVGNPRVVATVSKPDPLGSGWEDATRDVLNACHPGLFNGIGSQGHIKYFLEDRRILISHLWNIVTTEPDCDIEIILPRNLEEAIA